MALAEIHPLPMRKLLRDLDDSVFDLDAGDSIMLGPWMVQGYAWIVGTVRITTLGLLNSTFVVWQGFADAALVVPPAPPLPALVHWISDNAVGAIAPNIGVDFKIPVLGEGMAVILTNGSGEDGVVELMLYLRND